MKAHAVLLAAAFLAGCQLAPSGDRLTGNWVSDDGVSVTTFRGGAFTTRSRETGEAFVADGRYRQDPQGFAMTWTSILANEERSALCRFVERDRISCAGSEGSSFTMSRAG